MQIPQYTPGQDVRARGTRWRVLDVRPHGSCTVVTLGSTTARNTTRKLIDPFDTIEPIAQARLPKVVGVRKWRDVCRRLIAEDTPPGGIHEAHTSRIDLMPHQLEPAMAVVSGHGTRVLLADDVGLGKTIQAGLVLQELRARGWIDRVLVITPAGLREQWRQELQDRFSVKAAVVDARTIRRRAVDLPVGTNPWSTLDVAITSTDYVKRTEVLPAVIACRWDLVIVDEAHGVEGDSDRRDAVNALANRAAYVVLVTATPHNGNERAFAALCATGSNDEPLLVFRRRRRDVRTDAPRRLHTVAVRLRPPERSMHELLGRYAAAVRAEHGQAWLTLSVLHKRGFSGAWALLQSVGRRLAAFTGGLHEPHQMPLPLSDAQGEFSAADEPPAWPEDLGLSDRARERDLLTALAEAAWMAARSESKIAALRRLLRRTQEPVIVFTEYRDTLLHLREALAPLSTVVLHGGLTREDRTAALAAFSRTPRAVLLATDAAGEGLNLQHRCRLVVNLELPWNPMRLEQRVGRVDRIGQTRTVHAFHLVAAETGEAGILERLRTRIEKARAEIGAPDPIGIDRRDSERQIARLVIEGSAGAELQESSRAPSATPSIALSGPEDSARARIETDRLRCARAIASRRCDRDDTIDSDDPPLIVRASRRGLRQALGSRALMIWHIALENPAGMALESRLIPILVSGMTPTVRSHAQMKRLVNELNNLCAPFIADIGATWFETAGLTIRALADARRMRERSILARLFSTGAEGFQPGLFDRRAERSNASAGRMAAEFEHQVAERLAHLEQWSDVRKRAPRPLLVALP